jgi:Tol biopolymer transport system component
VRILLALFFLGLFCNVASLAQRPRETIAIRVQEGTNLSFDLSPDGRTIVFDLLGQLWLLPARGGTAWPITNAVRDKAEDLGPSFSPDGRRVVFHGERNGRTGLWLLSLTAGVPRQLTQLSNPDGYDGNAAWSPDGRVIAFERVVPPASSGSRARSAIVLLDVASGTARELPIAGITDSNISDPAWVRGGREIAFVTSKDRTERAGRIWIVSATGGEAIPITEESESALAPSFSADGRSVAYFAPDSAGRTQVWVRAVTNNGAAGSPIRLTNNVDVTPTRIRWVANENAWLYSADGRLWKVGRPYLP